MNLKFVLALGSIACGIALSSCKQSPPVTTNTSTANNKPAASKMAGPLPDEGFKAEVSIPDPPAKLRTGEVEVINIKVKHRGRKQMVGQGRKNDFGN